MVAVRLRTGVAMVALARASNGGAVLLVGLALGAAGQIGDFGVLARAIAIAHLAAQFTDIGGLAAFVARSADPMSPSVRTASRMWLIRRVARRVLILLPVVAVVATVFEVPWFPAGAVLIAISAQRLVAELLRSDGRTVEYAITSGLPSALWLVACLVAVAVGATPSASALALLFAAIVAMVSVAALVVVVGSGGVTESSGAAEPGLEVETALSGRTGLFVEGLLEAAVRNIDVILIAVVVGRDEAGLYAIASRLVAVAMTPLAAANGALAREYAERWADGGPVGLSALARSVARRITVVPALMTLIGVLVAVIVGPVSSGDGGAVGTVAQVASILLVSATVSTGAGSAGLLLGICRREVVSAWISAVAIVASVALLLVFGSTSGLVPAAVGFAIGVAAQNIAQAWYLRRHLGVISHL